MSSCGKRLTRVMQCRRYVFRTIDVINMSESRQIASRQLGLLLLNDHCWKLASGRSIFKMTIERINSIEIATKRADVCCSWLWSISKIERNDQKTAKHQSIAGLRHGRINFDCSHGYLPMHHAVQIFTVLSSENDSSAEGRSISTTLDCRRILRLLVTWIYFSY